MDCAASSCSACASRSAAIQRGLARAVGDDDDFGRAGDQVDPHLPEHAPLGGGDIGVAGADDLEDRRDRRRAIGQRRDRLRAADPVDFVDAGDARRRQHQRIDHAARRRHHHRDARAAGDARGRRVHQHRRGVAGQTAGHVEPDRLDRPPPPAKIDAELVAKAQILRHLPFVIGAHARMGEFERLPIRRGPIARRRRRSRARKTGGRPRAASKPSNFCVSSMRAASPRWRTSAMMPAATASTSAALSRLAASSA